MKMIADAKQYPKPFDCILVHKFDRFARNREDSVVYKSLLRKEYGIRVISISEQMEDDKFSIILESMLEAMAEYYSLNLSDEVKKGMTEKALRGELQTPAPLGYKMVEGILTADSDESTLVRLIFDLCANKKMKSSKIALYLNDMGYLTKKGNRFKKRSIEYIIKNPVYTGMVRWNSSKKGSARGAENEGFIVVKGRHAPIVDNTTWAKANENIKANAPREIIKSKNHYLCGILKCGRCFANMYISGKNGNLFRCGNYLNGKCGYSQGISITRVETAVLELLINDTAPEMCVQPKENQIRFIKQNVYAIFYDKPSNSLIIKSRYNC